MTLMHHEGGISECFLVVPLMEGMEHLSLTEESLDGNPVLHYMPTQLHHHEVVQALLSNPPTEGAERSI
jgi:hypothetical protein